MKEVSEYSSFLKIGFGLCSEVKREKVERAFSFMEEMGERLSRSEEEEVSTLLFFLDFYPFLALCGCSSIASANLYPEDVETKSLGGYDVFRKVSLVEHTLNGIITLNDLFSRMTDTGLYLKVHSTRFLLSACDYFYLLVSYLYHDVGKSPVILKSFREGTEQYRKVDHAFVSGQLLLFLRHELEYHKVKVAESSFNKIYLPVISHHQKTTDPFSVVLKYVDHKTREREMQEAGIVLPLVDVHLTKEEVRSTPETTKKELDNFWEIPDELFNAFYHGVVDKLLPRKRTVGGRSYETYFHFPPNVFVASHQVQFLLKYVTDKAGVVFPELENDQNALTVARQTIRKAREKGLIKDPLFSVDLLAGWWYRVRTREGEEKRFFGFPLYVDNKATPDHVVVDVIPMSKEEIEEMKKVRR